MPVHTYTRIKALTHGSGHAKVCGNAFYALSEGAHSHIVAVSAKRTLTTLELASHPCVAKDLTGGKDEPRLKKLREDVRTKFSGIYFAVKYAQGAFLITMTSDLEAVAFVNATFGVEVSIANKELTIHKELAGAVIGKKWKNIRRIEDAAPAKCRIYKDDGSFYIYFSHDTPAEQRFKSLTYVQMKLHRYSRWAEANLSDAASSVADSETASTCTDVSELSDFFSDMSPTPSEASDY
ncbi:hypothetical protein N9A45_00275 [bacterium]|nr:hypothetical protein [bacterium]